MAEKKKISITLNPTQVREVSDRVGDEYDNRSEAIRDLIDKGAEYDRLEAENAQLRETLEEYEALQEEYDEVREEYDTLQEEYDALEARRDDLQRQLAAVNARQEDVGDLVEFVEQQRELTRYQERRQRLLDEANILSRWKWKLTGVPVGAGDE